MYLFKFNYAVNLIFKGIILYYKFKRSNSTDIKKQILIKEDIKDEIFKHKNYIAKSFNKTIYHLIKINE